MSRKACPRAWEVEAARNGQLAGGKLRAHREHLANHCRECNAERHFLDKLAAQLRAASAPEDEVARRRLRQVVLERAVRTRTPHPRVGRGRWLLAALCLASALAPLAHRSEREVARPSLVEIIPLDKRSVFRRSREATVERVDLIDGVFTLIVRRGPADPRVLVRIPEGEIEDLGTTFSVTVLGGHTLRIVVNQGAVLLHRPNMPALRLEAGGVWEPAPPMAAEEPPPPEAAAAPLAAPPPKHAKHRRVARAPASDAPETLQDEDGMYLELLRLVRNHHDREARLMAADYLARHPDGFRRADVERVLRGLQF